MDLAALERLCVSRFPDSITRTRLMTNLVAVIDLLQRERMRGDIWIDGSFITEKLNPDDVDLLLRVNVSEYRTMDAAQLNFLSWLSNNSLSGTHKCDSYVMLVDDAHPQGEYMQAYWLHQFGFSRAGQMKGLAVVRLPFVVVP